MQEEERSERERLRQEWQMTQEVLKGTCVLCKGDVCEGDVCEGDVCEGDVCEGDVCEGDVCE